MVEIQAKPYYHNAFFSEFLVDFYGGDKYSLKVQRNFEYWLAYEYGAHMNEPGGNKIIFKSLEEAVYFKLKFGSR